MNLSELKEIFLNFFFPSICFSCKKDIPYNHKHPLCPKCVSELFYISKPYCEICGIFLENGGRLCYNCFHKKEKYNFEFSRSVFMYNKSISSIILAYKYGRIKWLYKWLSFIIIERFRFYDEFKEYNAITYVPLSRIKEFKRGFNQTQLIADKLSRHYNLPLINSLIKIKETKNQVALNQEERKKNLVGSFIVRVPDDVKNKNIIVIDDVATTMSTLNEVSKTLRNAGAKRVCCYTVAKE